MKYFFTKYRFFLSGAALILTAASCTSTLSDEPATDARAISFTPAAETRAAVETDFPDDSRFSVWGWYGTDDQITNNVFNGETVTKSGNNWSYDGGTRYWIPEMTYNFYGVYPFYPQTSSDNGTTATVDNTGKITVTNFDCSATGENAVDLMTATAPGLSGDAAPTVAMKFQHQLSKINIVGTVEGGNCTVTSVKFEGMATKGNYNSSDPNKWTTDATPDSFTSNVPKTLNTNGVDLLGNLLLIPQTVTDQFNITVNYEMDGETKTKNISLPTSIGQWEAGQSYKYTLTFKGNNIIFTVNVASWGHSTGGIITVE